MRTLIATIVLNSFLNIGAVRVSHTLVWSQGSERFKPTNIEPKQTGALLNTNIRDKLTIKCPETYETDIDLEPSVEELETPRIFHTENEEAFQNCQILNKRPVLDCTKQEIYMTSIKRDVFQSGISYMPGQNHYFFAIMNGTCTKLKLHVISKDAESDLENPLNSGFTDPVDMLTEDELNPQPSFMIKFQKLVDDNEMVTGAVMGAICMCFFMSICFFIYTRIMKKQNRKMENLNNSERFHDDRFQSIRYVAAIDQSLQGGQNLQGPSNQHGMQQGMQQGHQQGLQQGLQQGHQQGHQQGLQQGIQQTSYNHPALQHQVSMNSYGQYSPNDSGNYNGNYNGQFQPTISQNHVMSANGINMPQQTLTRHFPHDISMNMNNSNMAGNVYHTPTAMYQTGVNPNGQQFMLPQNQMQSQHQMVNSNQLVNSGQNQQIIGHNQVQADGAFMKNSGGGSNGKTTESSHLSSDYASENQVPEKISCPSTSSSSGIAAQIQVQNDVDHVVEI